MKKICILSFLLLLAVESKAQDVLVTEAGDAIKAWGVDMGSTKIYYRTSEDSDAPLQSIEKYKVLVWKKADGSRIVIGQQEELTAPATTTTVTKTVSTVSYLDASDPEANQRAIKAFNLGNVNYTKEPSDRNADALCGLFHMSSNSVIVDKNVEILFKKPNIQYKTEGISITLRNKSDKNIYIYLGNTFFLRNGVATPFNTSSASQTVGNGMAAAASGFSQSVIAVPAQSSFDLGLQPIASEESKNAFNLPIEAFKGTAYEPKGWFITESHEYYHIRWRVPNKDAQIKAGEERFFTQDNSPLKYGFKLTYSFSEDNTQLYHLDAQMYLSKILGYQFMKGLKIVDYKVEVNSPFIINMGQIYK